MAVDIFVSFRQSSLPSRLRNRLLREGDIEATNKMQMNPLYDERQLLNAVAADSDIDTVDTDHQPRTATRSSSEQSNEVSS